MMMIGNVAVRVGDDSLLVVSEVALRFLQVVCNILLVASDCSVLLPMLLLLLQVVAGTPLLMLIFLKGRKK